MFFVLIFGMLLLVAIILEVTFIILTISSFEKENKTNAYIFLSLSILIPTMFLLLFFGLNGITKPRTLTKNDIITTLKTESIIINDDFTILESKSEEDLYFFRTQFKLKLSKFQSKELYENNLFKDTLKNVMKKENGTYDTIKIILEKEEILDFYRSKYDYNN